MNKYLVIIMVLSGLIACTKSNDDLPYYAEISNTEYVGQWEWVATGGGVTGLFVGPAEYGEHTLTLTAGSAYELISKDGVIASGEYSIIESDMNNITIEEITFRNFPLADNGLVALAPQNRISINGDQLIMGGNLSIQYVKAE